MLVFKDIVKLNNLTSISLNDARFLMQLLIISVVALIVVVAPIVVVA